MSSSSPLAGVVTLFTAAAIALACAACSSSESRACQVDANCFVDERCVTGFCQIDPHPDADIDAPGTDASTCAAGMELCGASCVDLSTDDDFCGTCHIACDGDDQCVAGQCETRLPSAPIGRIGENVANGKGVGADLAIDPQGRPHISYLDQEEQRIGYVWWTGEAWEADTVTTNTGASQTKIAVDDHGVPHIAFTAPTDTDSEDELIVASFDGSEWHMSPLLTRSESGSFSLALNSENLPRIAYYDPDAGMLKLAERQHNGQWTFTDVAPTSSTGNTVALAVDAHDRHHIAYRENAAKELRYATPSPEGEWGSVLVDEDYNSGFSVSITLDHDGLPHIASRAATPSGLLYARQRDDGSWNVLHRAMDPGVDSRPASIAVNSLGAAYMGFTEAFRAKVLVFTEGEWSSAFDQEAGSASRTAITIAPDDTLHLVHEFVDGGRYYHRSP